MNKEQMFNNYNSVAYTHDYIIGFVLKKRVYVLNCKSDFVKELAKLDHNSKGEVSLRLNLNANDRFKMLDAGAICLCTEDEFNSYCKANKYNKGDNFEHLIAERNGIEWAKSGGAKIAFTEEPDLTINGVGYQLKFEKATITDEGKLKRLGF